MKADSIDSIKVCTLAFKRVKSAADYHRIGNANTPETLAAAWNVLSEAEQRRITDILNNNTQPDPQAIADEMTACGTALELRRVKSEYGDVAVRSAWKLLSQSERDRIRNLCAESQSEPQTRDSSEISATYPENVAQADTWLDKQGLSQSQPEPEPHSAIKKSTLIELTAELEQLDNLLERIEGDIPAEIQVAVDELLNQRSATHEAVLEKLDSYCGLIQSRLLWATARKAEAERLAHLAESDMKSVDFLKARLKAHLEISGQNKVRTKRFNVAIRLTGGKQALRLNSENPKDLPERFQRVIIEPDNTRAISF